MRKPARRLPKKVNVAAPRISERKNRRRSAPPIVRGLLMETYTGCTRGVFVITPSSWKEPGHKVDGPNGHSDPKHNASQEALGSAFAEGKRDAPHHNRHQAEATRDGTREADHQDVDRVLPRRGLRVRRRRGQHDCRESELDDAWPRA